MNSFHVKQVKQDLIQWIRDCFETNGKGCNAVLGISGGKDSTIAAALCVEALGKDRVIGVMMPNGVQSDIADSQAVCQHLGIQNFEINIQDAYNAISAQVGAKISLTEQSKINLAPRLRMSTLYAVAQSLNGRVINTSNKSEAWIGYSTRYGDGVGDFAPLLNLTATEVIALGKELNLPEYLVVKAPADGLTGKTDEDKLGFTYQALDRYIRTGEIENAEWKEKIDRLHKINSFKTKLMPSFPYEK